MTELICATCIHFDGRFQSCQELQGCLLCKRCQKPFKLHLGENERDEPFHCPSCQERGFDMQLEDVSGGRSEHCPGHQSRPLKQVARSLF